MIRFGEEEIEAARRLRRSGPSWEPSPGHYVYDETGFCNQAPPFQEKVYFILEYPYLMRAVGGVGRFEQIILWLPTWDDLREFARDAGHRDVDVASVLNASRAIESGQARLALYKLIEARLSKFIAAPAPSYAQDRS